MLHAATTNLVSNAQISLFVGLDHPLLRQYQVARRRRVSAYDAELHDFLASF